LPANSLRHLSSIIRLVFEREDLFLNTCLFFLIILKSENPKENHSDFKVWRYIFAQPTSTLITDEEVRIRKLTYKTGLTKLPLIIKWSFSLNDKQRVSKLAKGASFWYIWRFLRFEYLSGHRLAWHILCSIFQYISFATRISIYIYLFLNDHHNITLSYLFMDLLNKKIFN
jgi:hypothetical protein